MKVSRIVLATVAFASCFAFQATAQTVLKLGNDIAPTSIQAKACEAFAEEVAKRNVDLKVEVFHANQLGTGVQQIQNVKLGIQDMVNTGWELLGVFSQDLKIGETPFTFSGREHFEAWVRSPMFDKAHQEVIKNGNQRIINLGEIWRRGPFRVMIANRPVRSPEDLATFKIRTHESDAIKRYWGKEGLGATVIVLALADVYPSFRSGLVDGFTMPFDLVVPFKWAEVGKHIMYTREAPQMVSLMINEDRWKSLNDAQRTALHEAADAAGRFYNQQIEQSLEQWKMNLTEMGVTFHEIDIRPFVERSRNLSMKLEKEGFWRAGLIAEIDSLRKR